MEEFIYIILIVGWVALSIMKKKSKAKSTPKPGRPASRPKPASPPRGISLEDALREVLGIPPATQAKPEPAKEIPAMEPEKPSPGHIAAEEETTVYKEYEYRSMAEELVPYEALEYHSMAEELAEYQESEYQSFAPEESIPGEYQVSAEIRSKTLEEMIRSFNLEEAHRQIADEEIGTAEVQDIAYEFDVRKAIVFSEILNRKYS